MIPKKALKLYHEHPEFHEYSQFDFNSGVLTPIDKERFELLSPSCRSYTAKKPTSLHTRFPRRVYFQITRKCNLHCQYCFIKADATKPNLNAGVIFEFAKYFGQQGLMEVRLTGGEPTLHPEFIPICEEFEKNQIYVSVASNGLWSEAIQDYFASKKNLFLIVSVDGDAELHNRYRKNSYASIMQNLMKLRARNNTVRIRINTVLTKANKSRLESLARLVMDVEGESITLIPLRPQLRNKLMLAEMLTAQEFHEVIKEMIVYKDKYGIAFTTTLEMENKNVIMKDKIFTKRSSCAAGREGTNLDFDYMKNKMFMYACSYCPASDLHAIPKIRKPFVAGEFAVNKVEQFGEIWENNSNWELFRDLSLKPIQCQNCLELGKRCTGGCPIQNLNLDKIVTEANIKLQLRQQMRATAEWYCYKNLD